jgi:hypothetical protein
VLIQGCQILSTPPVCIPVWFTRWAPTCLSTCLALRNYLRLLIRPNHEPEAVTHTYNPRYLGGKDWEDCETLISINKPGMKVLAWKPS